MAVLAPIGTALASAPATPLCPETRLPLTATGSPQECLRPGSTKRAPDVHRGPPFEPDRQHQPPGCPRARGSPWTCRCSGPDRQSRMFPVRRPAAFQSPASTVDRRFPAPGALVPPRSSEKAARRSFAELGASPKTQGSARPPDGHALGYCPARRLRPAISAFHRAGVSRGTPQGAPGAARAPREVPLSASSSGRPAASRGHPSSGRCFTWNTTYPRTLAVHEVPLDLLDLAP